LQSISASIEGSLPENTATWQGRFRPRRANDLDCWCTSRRRKAFCCASAWNSDRVFGTRSSDLGACSWTLSCAVRLDQCQMHRKRGSQHHAIAIGQRLAEAIG